MRSTDGASGGESFETDPFEPLGRTAHPFVFFGFLPTLFDAPSRDPLGDMDWVAHSFLCQLGEQEQQARAILGFSWGFNIRDAAITLYGPNALAAGDWDAHRTLLAREHAGWSFTPGFASS